MPRKKKTQVDPEPKPDPTSEAIVPYEKVKNPDGTDRLVKRDEKGHFLKTKKKPVIPESEVTRITRNILFGKAQGDSETRIKKMLRSATEAAITCFQDPETAGNGAKVMDALARWAKITLPNKTEDQVEAEKQNLGNLKVIINTPVLMNPVPVVEEEEKQLKPSFIEAQVISEG